MNQPKQTLEFITSAILPDSDIEINTQDKHGTLNLEVSVPQVDMGKIIGKGGHIIKSIRAVMAVAYPQSKLYINLIEKTDLEPDKA